MDILDNYPEIKKLFEKLYLTRRDEILAHMLEADNEYMVLCCKRAEASMSLKNVLTSIEANDLFEEYSDAIFEQEIYELHAIYKQALIDAIIALRNQGLLT